MCSITGVGERLHKVLGQIDLGTLDSGERSLPFGLLVCIFHTCINRPAIFPDLGWRLPAFSLLYYIENFRQNHKISSICFFDNILKFRQN